jgi:hypothetical protein
LPSLSADDIDTSSVRLAVTRPPDALTRPEVDIDAVSVVPPRCSVTVDDADALAAPL